MADLSTVFSKWCHFKYLLEIKELISSGEVPQNPPGLLPFEKEPEKGDGSIFLLRENRSVPFFPNDCKEFNAWGTAYRGKGRFDIFSFSLTY